MNNKHRYLLIILSILTLLLFSCNEKELASGEWNILVTSTPMGDFEGILNISMEGEELVGTVNFPGRVETTMKNVEMDGRNLSFSFDSPSGYTSIVEGKIEGDEFTGSLSVDESSYPFEANRNLSE